MVCLVWSKSQRSFQNLSTYHTDQGPTDWVSDAPYTLLDTKTLCTLKFKNPRKGKEAESAILLPGANALEWTVNSEKYKTNLKKNLIFLSNNILGSFIFMMLWVTKIQDIHPKMLWKWALLLIFFCHEHIHVISARFFALSRTFKHVC